MKDLHRVFLDTNIVWNLHSFSEEIYDNTDFDEGIVLSKIGKRGLEDLEALRKLTQVAERYGSIEFVTAESTLSELGRKMHDNKGIDRIRWGFELFNWWLEEISINYPEEDFNKYEKLAQDIFMSNRLYFLHDSEDEILILNAVARNCGVFLTMDYKTIWNLKNRIKAVVPLSVSKPLEYWNYVKRLL